jgi:hypothetical protein
VLGDDEVDGWEAEPQAIPDFFQSNDHHPPLDHGAGPTCSIIGNGGRVYSTNTSGSDRREIKSAHALT